MQSGVDASRSLIVAETTWHELSGAQLLQPHVQATGHGVKFWVGRVPAPKDSVAHRLQRACRKITPAEGGPEAAHGHGRLAVARCGRYAHYERLRGQLAYVVGVHRHAARHKAPRRGAATEAHRNVLGCARLATV